MTKQNYMNREIGLLSHIHPKPDRSVTLRILSTIARDNSVTIAQIAGTAEINDRTVQRYLKEFQDAGILRREGSDTDGKWILI